MTGSDPIKLLRVAKAFGPVRAVVDVTMELHRGSLVVIEGANGSGKTTLLWIIGTLIRPTSGRIDYGFLGSNVSAIRARMGWVGHETICYADLTGRENIELAARLAGVDVRQAWEHSIERFGLGDAASRAMRSASRGQRQQVALARALVATPALLLLDEPSTGLDAAAAARVSKIVAEEVVRGTIVIVITHDEQFARSLRGVRYRMERGRLRNASG